MCCLSPILRLPGQRDAWGVRRQDELTLPPATRGAFQLRTTELLAWARISLAVDIFMWYIISELLLMAHAGVFSDPPLSPNPSGMRRTTRPGSKSRSLCRYKTDPHLFIPLALETACSQPFAQNHNLTPAVCADPQSRGEGPAVRSLWRRTGLPSVVRLVDPGRSPASGRGALFASRLQCRESRPFGTHHSPAPPRRSNFTIFKRFHTPMRSRKLNTCSFNRLRTPVGGGPARRGGYPFRLELVTRHSSLPPGL